MSQDIAELIAFLNEKITHKIVEFERLEKYLAQEKDQLSRDLHLLEQMVRNNYPFMKDLHLKDTEDSE